MGDTGGKKTWLDRVKENISPKGPGISNEVSGQGDNPENGRIGAGYSDEGRLLGINGSENGDKSRDVGQNSLKDAEGAAAESGGDSERKNPLEQATEIEDNPTGLYKQSKNKGKVKVRGFGVRGPVAMIAAMFMVVGAFLLGGQATLPFSYIAQYQEALDSMGTVNKLRSKTILLKQMQNTNVSDPIHKRLFGFAGTEFKISKKQRSNLAKQGIYVDDDFGGTGKAAMLFDDGSGQLKVIAANDDDVNLFKSVDPGKIKLDQIDVDADFSKFSVDLNQVSTHDVAYRTNDDYHFGYLAGSLNWRGSVGLWFDNTTLKFLQSNKLTRNRFKNFQERVERRNAGNTKSARAEVVNEAMQRNMNESIDVETNEVRETEEGEENKGNTSGEEGEEVNGTVEKINTRLTMGQETKATMVEKINKIVKGKLGSTVSGFSTGANLACMVFGAFGVVSVLAMTAELTQLFNVTSAMFEVTHKTMAGDGDDAPQAEFATMLTQPAPSTVLKDTGGEDFEEEVIPGKENTSAMQSAGSKALYNNEPVDFEDPNFQNFNVMSHFNNVFTWLGTSVASFSGCLAAKAAAAVATGVITSVKLISAFLTGGLSSLFTTATEKIGTAFAKSFAISEIASLITNDILPIVATWFTRNLVSNLAGESLGNAIFIGAVAYMGVNHFLGGGSAMTRRKYAQFAAAQQGVIAEEADFQRKTRSPFDPTSKYTFIGSIFNKLAAIQTVKSPVLGGLGTITRMVSSSITDLLPTAVAYDTASTLVPEEDYAKLCPDLQGLDIAGSAACIPYAGSDLDTINYDPIEVADYVINDDNNLTNDGEVVEGSTLSNVLKDCNNRSILTYGAVDNSVVSRHSVRLGNTGDTEVDNMINSAVGVTPVVGDIFDIADSAVQAANIGWIDADSCTAKGGVSTAGGEGAGSSSATLADESGEAVEDAGDWTRLRMYQRFIEDQRYLESLDSSFESPITAYYKKQEAENPTDTSLEGLLAKQSGLSKEEVSDGLAVVEYYEYVNSYDPGDRIAFGEDDEIGQPIRLENESETKFAGVSGAIANLMVQISFADVRNRTAVV